MLGHHRYVFRIMLAAGGCAIVAACAAAPKLPPDVPEVRPGILQGYLATEALPNSLALIPPPPSAGSAAYSLDDDVSRATRALQGSKRWALAAEDNNLMFPRVAGTFSCALGAPVSEEYTPHLYRVLRRTVADAGLATYFAKNHYERTRPFVENGAPMCAPEEQEQLTHDGSYPSGHTAVGWAWALILAEMAPDRTDAILERGWAFGQSRVVCNVHWQSDVIMGRVIGAAAVARLQADSMFRADVELAKTELAAVRAKGLVPTRDCRDEAEALAELAPDAPWPANR